MLGYYWPSNDVSEVGSSASGDPESWSHEEVDGWMSGADDVMVGDPGWEGLGWCEISSCYSEQYAS